MMTLRFTRVPSLGLEVLHASNLTHAYPAHVHEHDSIGVLLHGEERIHCDDRTHILLPGNAFVVAAEEIHSGESLDAEYLLVKVMTGRAMPTGVIDDLHVASILLDLLLSLDRGAVSASALSHLFDRIPLNTSFRPNKGTSISKVRDYLKVHRTAGVTLHELTTVAHLSRFHLVRRFRRAIGVTPHEYQTHMRIAHVRRLLRMGKPIAEAAARAGFVDQSHLTRHFKRIVGMTPGDYVARSNIVQDRFRAAR